MSDNQHQHAALEHAAWAENQVGEQSATSDALYSAQIATAHALLAVVNELRALRLALCGDENGLAAPGAGGRLGEIAAVLEAGVFRG